MRKPLRLALAAAALAAVPLWYFFRPERAFFDRTMNEAPPTGAVRVLAGGTFAPRSHEGEGRAEILQLADGGRVLRVTGFATLNGPDLQVYLLARTGVNGRAELQQAGFTTLGPLKGNRGEQNYAIPAGVDLARFPAVAIWCRRFAVNFTDAPLVPTPREQETSP